MCKFDCRETAFTLNRAIKDVCLTLDAFLDMEISPGKLFFLNIYTSIHYDFFYKIFI